ncbi:dihydrofolate reductase [Methylobacterium sp. SD21]|uniref:dihydrofolate reductase n=1 Tax=Methylobacterium litchii TaxID=3138810 RepID=UPI00313D9044
MAAPTIALVVAVARNGVIGRDNGLAWHLSSDLKRFKALTMGATLLMGRRTWDSIGRPLPGRRTLVLTRDPAFRVEGAETVHEWESAVAAAGDRLMVVGGAEVYALALPQADIIHLTEVEAEPEGDVRFPAFDRASYREVFREAHPAGPKDDYPYAFIDLARLR